MICRGCCVTKYYAERDIEALDRAGWYYSRHVEAMTAEGLHAKSDIAAELAHRDQLIVTLRETLAMARAELSRSTTRYIATCMQRDNAWKRIRELGELESVASTTPRPAPPKAR